MSLPKIGSMPQDDWHALVLLADYFGVKKDESTERFPGICSIPKLPELAKVIIDEHERILKLLEEKK